MIDKYNTAPTVMSILYSTLDLVTLAVLMNTHGLH
jgi:hypothetical protein